nr:cytochrome P450 [Tanacetum cinerariifolium]
MDFIKELVHVTYGDDLILIRVVETDGEIDSLFNGNTLTSFLYGESNGTSILGGSDDEFGEDSYDGGHEEKISVKNSSESAHMENVGENKELVMVSDTCFKVRSTSDAEHAVNDKNHAQSRHVLEVLGCLKVGQNSFETSRREIWRHNYYVGYIEVQHTVILSCDGFLAVMGNWIPLNTTCVFIVVYAPQDPRKKKQLWLDLKAVIVSANVLSLVMGDFNVVHSQSEHIGSNFCHRNASTFNEFISSSGLFDIPIGGMRFTRMNKSGSKLSKIDRILVSKHLFDKWPNSHILALTCEFSDHSPLLLINNSNDFGPTPFKFYNSWLLHVDFHQIITNYWISVDVGYATTQATSHPSFSSNLFKCIPLEQNSLLSNPFTTQEIKDVVWDCGGDKAPGLDGFSFKLIKKHWNLLGSDIVSYVHEFYHSANILPNRLALVIPSLMGEVQMAFIKGRQITDGPLLVNEIISWAKKHKKLLLLKEFKIEKGLRQGDPMSPFLFMLAVEALNVVFLEARNNNIFHGVDVGNDKIPISHLQFADDALIIVQWSPTNIKNLSRILTCFNIASELKVNFNKSKLFGIGVPTNDVNSMAHSIGCIPSQLPCIYLGLPIGANMTRCSNWSDCSQNYYPIQKYNPR